MFDKAYLLGASERDTMPLLLPDEDSMGWSNAAVSRAPLASVWNYPATCATNVEYFQRIDRAVPEASQASHSCIRLPSLDDAITFNGLGWWEQTHQPPVLQKGPPSDTSDREQAAYTSMHSAPAHSWSPLPLDAPQWTYLQSQDGSLPRIESNNLHDMLRSPNGTPCAPVHVVLAPGQTRQQTARTLEGDAVHCPHGQPRREQRTERRTTTRRGDRETKAVKHSRSLLAKLRSAPTTHNWTIHGVEGCIVLFSRDQIGSRFIQQRVETGHRSEQQLVIQEVLPAMPDLCDDVFGNFVVQKLLVHGSPIIKRILRDSLAGKVLVLSLQTYGCRVIQAAIESLEDDDLPRLLRELDGHLVQCIQDANGNHVIQKAIQVLNLRATEASSVGMHEKATCLRGQLDFIVDASASNTLELAFHPYGCRILQRILEHCPTSKAHVVLDKLKPYDSRMLENAYGNFVIQHVVQHGRDVDRDEILDLILHKGILQFSRQKTASNVVEKVLKYGCRRHQVAVVREMLQLVDDPVSSPNRQIVVALLMVRDAYANYVVQTALQILPKSRERRLLVNVLALHMDEMRKYTFAKHTVAILDAARAC